MGACFQYGAQACRLSFPFFYIPSGTPVGDLALVTFFYLFREASGRLGRAGFLPLSTVTPLFSSLFRSWLHFFSPSSLFSAFPFSWTWLPQRWTSGDIFGRYPVWFLESRYTISGHLLLVRVGYKACSRSFLRWCGSDLFCYFHDNPQQDWHDGLTVSSWPQRTSRVGSFIGQLAGSFIPVLLSGFRGVQGAIGETCSSTPWRPLLLGLGVWRVIPRVVFIRIPSLSELGPRRILYPGSLSRCPRQILLLPPGVACRHTCRPASLGLLRVTLGIPALSLVCLGQALQMPKGGHCSPLSVDELPVIAARAPPKAKVVIGGTYWGYG